MANKNVKKGRCVNYGNCTNADNNEIIEVDALEALDGNFKCPKCHKELEEVAEKSGGKGKLIAIIVAALIVIGGGIGTWVCLSGEPEEVVVDPQPPQGGGVEQPEVQQGEGQEDQQGEPQEEPQGEEQGGQQQGGEVEQPGDGKIDLGYATYDGDSQNGQPHGNGTLYFKQEHVIPGTVDVTAAAGEKVIGSFRNGKINMGTVYRKDGNEAIVKAGQRK